MLNLTEVHHATCLLACLLQHLQFTADAAALHLRTKD